MHFKNTFLLLFYHLVVVNILLYVRVLRLCCDSKLSLNEYCIVLYCVQFAGGVPWLRDRPAVNWYDSPHASQSQRTSNHRTSCPRYASEYLLLLLSLYCQAKKSVTSAIAARFTVEWSVRLSAELVSFSNLFCSFLLILSSLNIP